MIRSILAVVAGAVVGFLAIVAVEMVSSLIYPLPPGVEPYDRAALRELMATVPAGALLMVALAHVLGTAAGAAVAARVARRAPVGHAVAVGALFLAAGVGDLLMLPHPAWFWPVDLAMFPLGAYVGLRIGHRRPVAA
jgi:hypothetical protein